MPRAKVPWSCASKTLPALPTVPREENNDPNNSESFALGMSLFGKDVSSVEREVRDRLSRIEAELKDIVIAVQSQGKTIEEDQDYAPADPESL